MSNRPDIELALDVRSYERVVVIAGKDSTNQYPESWTRPVSSANLDVDPESIVVIDRVELKWETLEKIAEGRPRLVAFAMANVDHEKRVRKMITEMFPWNEVWTVSTSFGKLLITKDITGSVYNRDSLVDARPSAAA